MQQLTEKLNSQLMSGMGMSAAGQGSMPPPPPEDAGFSKEELTQHLAEISGSDSSRSALIENIIENFEQADADGDGLVSFKEAMAFDQTAVSSSSSQGNPSSSPVDITDLDTNDKLLQQILLLMQAYTTGNETDAASAVSVMV